ncbi:universal stress protein [Streptomyces sp. SS1-1]|uniref:universal stress protein n=1 Tax=Streptomyces sp. SS1-1 TaxID=2651869 RepID=UPI00124F9EB5|nr:universal stress protein [Streptomyces sp. SS1-1]KAB2977386.1 universal stress protein [Streptomyces sp. SS1-1]
MTLPLIVGVDGSDPSLVAVDWAVDEAVRHGLTLRLVHASLWERYAGTVPTLGGGRFSERVLAEHLVSSAAERAARRAPGLRITTDILPADAVDGLLHEGANAHALVVGDRGRGELKGLLLGSVSLAVAARAHCPVIVVRGDEPGIVGLHERILLGVGDPATSGRAVDFAVREAEARGCVLDAVRAWRHPAPIGAETAGDGDQERQAATLLDEALRAPLAAHPDVRVRRATVEGAARTVLVDRSAAADLVILGARRRHGHFGLQMGRVGHRLLHHAECPVAIVPQLA